MKNRSVARVLREYKTVIRSNNSKKKKKNHFNEPKLIQISRISEIMDSLASKLSEPSFVAGWTAARSCRNGDLVLSRAGNKKS